MSCFFCCCRARDPSLASCCTSERVIALLPPPPPPPPPPWLLCAHQERTNHYISQKRLELIELLCNGRGTLAHLFDFSSLRFKHRDELETAIKSWDARIACDSTFIEQPWWGDASMAS
jgi:hypothetical protein